MKFWRSVVVKLALTIMLLVAFVLFILTILLLEFFENFHIQEAESDMLQTANKVYVLLSQQESESLTTGTVETVKNPESRVAIVFDDESIWVSNSSNSDLLKLKEEWFNQDEDIAAVLEGNTAVRKQMNLPNSEIEVMLVGIPFADNGAIFVYQSLDVIEQTKAETTRIILLAAGIAIILTTFFAFFLSTRITSHLIKMRE